MRAIIPVAGIGSRLKPHTYSTPKVLLNVGGKPILGHILDKLLEEGIHKSTFVIGYLGDMIKEYVEREYPEISSLFIEQKEMKGLGHAIYTAIPTFDDKEIFIILGDTIFDVDVKDVLKNKKSALGVKEVEDPSRFGVAICNNGFIDKLVEKPQTKISNLALVGLYYLADSDVLIKSLNQLIEKDMRTRGELQLTDALQLMIDAGEKITTFPVEGWYDCGKPETLLSTNKILLDKRGTDKIYKNVLINNPVYISDGVEIENSVIGPYATIDKGSKIRDSIVRNSIIGFNTEVSKTLLENSIVGNNAVIKGTFKRFNAGNSSELDF